MQISRGKKASAQKVVIYAPEGWGKSTAASKMPDPVFIDTEGSTKMLDVARLEADYSKPFYRENAIKNGKKVSRPVARYTKDGQYIDSFESARDAVRKLGLTSSHITECCRCQRKSSNGYVWRYERRDDLSDYQF